MSELKKVKMKPEHLYDFPGDGYNETLSKLRDYASDLCKIYGDEGIIEIRHEYGYDACEGITYVVTGLRDETPQEMEKRLRKAERDRIAAAKAKIKREEKAKKEKEKQEKEEIEMYKYLKKKFEGKTVTLKES